MKEKELFTSICPSLSSCAYWAILPVPGDHDYCTGGHWLSYTVCSLLKTCTKLSN